MVGEAMSLDHSKFESFGDVVDYLDVGPPSLDAAHQLLLYLRENISDYGVDRAAYPKPKRLRAAASEIAPTVRSHDSMTFPAGVGPQLTAWRNRYSDLSDELAVRALAEAIDGECGVTFFAQAQHYYFEERQADAVTILGRRVRALDPVPIASRLVEALSDQKTRTTNPYNLPQGRRGDRLRQLALAPHAVEELEVAFDFSLSDAIDAMIADGSTGLKVGICLPTKDFATDYTRVRWTRVERCSLTFDRQMTEPSIN